MISNTTILYQSERLQDIWDEIFPILKDHYKEIAHYQDIKLEPNVREYFILEDLRIIKVFTAREENELIGYNIFFIRHNMHYKSSLQALNDVIYIKKDKRGFGKEFIKWCDEELKKLGVQVVFHHIKNEHNWGKVLEKMDYKLIDLIYGKRLDKE